LEVEKGATEKLAVVTAYAEMGAEKNAVSAITALASTSRTQFE